VPELHNSLFYFNKTMKKNHRFIGSLIHKYFGRLSVVFLFNLLSVCFTIFIFLMIEPFSKLVFRGTLSDLSPVGTFFVRILGTVVNLKSLASSIFGIVCTVVVLFLLKNVTVYASQWFMAPMRSDLLFSLRNNLYDKILRLPIGYFNQQKRGDVVSRAVNDTQEIEYTILNSIKQLMTEPISIVIFMIALFYISYSLTLYSLVLMPVTFLIIGRISNSLRKNARTSKQRMGSLLSHVEETVSGLRIIKGFNAQENAEKIFNRLNLQFVNTQKKIYRKVDLASPLSEFMGVTIVMVVLVIGGSMVLSPHSSLSAELFITYIALFTQIINPVKTVATALSNYKRGMAALDRIDEVMSADEVIIQPKCPIPVHEFNDNIQINHVSFAYDTQEVLSDISFEIKKGECIALVGQSGAGKSTFADLLERFYDPTKGEILIDGIDIKYYDINNLRSLYALVSQDVVLFNDSLYNNIAIGMPNVQEKDIIEAAKVANIYDFIQTLPNGIYHNVGDRGLNLSGGQRQRISIARAVLRNAPILILDEATSAMDTESERAVQQALDNVMQNRTVIVIAHRLSTIQNANRIYVLDNGKIVEQGTHESLMAQGGLYQKLIQIQQFN